MKHIAKLVLIVLLTGLTYSNAETRNAATPTLIVVGVSMRQTTPELNKAAEIIVKTLFDTAQCGDEIAVVDVGGMKQAADFKVPMDVSLNSQKLKKTFFDDEIGRLLLYFKEHQAKEGDADLNIPAFTRYLEARKQEETKRKVRALLIGSPLHHSDDEFFGGMPSGFLPDRVFFIQGTPFSVVGVGKEVAIKDVDVHWIYLKNPFINSYHAEMTERFLNLFFALQGGRLLTFTSDPAAYRRVANSGITHKSFEVNENDVKLEVHSVENVIIPSIGQGLTSNPPPPQSTVSQNGLEIFAAWEGGRQIDVDLYVQLLEMRELCYRHRKNEVDGKTIRWIKDRDTGAENVMVPAGLKVDIRKVEAYLSFYAGHAKRGVDGMIYVYFENKVYAAPFHIRAAKGDEGKSRRTARTWFRLDLARIVGLQ